MCPCGNPKTKGSKMCLRCRRMRGYDLKECPLCLDHKRHSAFCKHTPEICIPCDKKRTSDKLHVLSRYKNTSYSEKSWLKKFVGRVHKNGKPLK